MPGRVPHSRGKRATQNPRRDIYNRLEERRVGDGAKATVKQLATYAFATLVDESFDDMLCFSYHSAQSGFRSVVYIVLEQVLLDLLHKDVISDTMDALMTKCFDTCAAAKKLSKSLLKLSSFMAPLVTFVQRQISPINAEKNKVFARVSKKDLLAATEVYDDTIENLPSSTALGSESTAVEGPPDVHGKNALQSANTATFNDIRTP